MPILHIGMGKYTKEQLTPIVEQSTSLIGVVRKLGITSYGGGTQAYIKNVIAKYGIDTSHFFGKANNRGSNHKGGSPKRTAENILKLVDKGSREHSKRLHRALIEIGREYKCECCNQEPVWNGRKLTLQIDHKNGVSYDNRPDNLRFLCPNCHTQTDTFGGKNVVPR